ARYRSQGEEMSHFKAELIWSRMLPSKCKFFFWCTLLNSILTKDILNHRGQNLDLLCSMCNLGNESISHLFMHCSKALEVWYVLLQPRRRSFSNVLTADTVEELLIAWPKGKGGHLGSRIWELLPYAVIWVFWRIRNDLIFSNKLFSVERTCNEIKATLWYWLGAWPGRRHYCYPDLVN
ncbi:hypothetical protein FRX31_024143, partial [Thalictrum thalictroides]